MLIRKPFRPKRNNNDGTELHAASKFNVQQNAFLSAQNCILIAQKIAWSMENSMNCKFWICIAHEYPKIVPLLVLRAIQLKELCSNSVSYFAPLVLSCVRVLIPFGFFRLRFLSVGKMSCQETQNPSYSDSLLLVPLNQLLSLLRFLCRPKFW